MVKNMYKETAKSGKSPMLLILGWVVFIYVYYILWGIGEILLEIKVYFAIKHLILFAISSVLCWSVIYKYLTEYDFATRKHEFTVTKRLSRKTKVVCTIKYDSIEAIYNEEEKKKLKDYTFSKKLNFVLAHQGGKKLYIIYRFDSKLYLATLKASRNMARIIYDNAFKKEEESL